MMKLKKKQSASRPNGKGSALVVVVVLTVLLATIGTLFVMASRLSQASTASIADNKDLQSGVETVLAKIKTVLSDDLFGSDGKMLNSDGSDEPYDYPDPCDDPWLASIEPKRVSDGGTPLDPSDDIYAWNHITDLYNSNFGLPPVPPYYYDPVDRSKPEQWDSTRPESDEYQVDIGVSGIVARIVSEDEGTSIIVDQGSWDNPADVMSFGGRADADGDGVADSRWIRLPGMTGSKGQPIFAAVRIIDNCAMLNLNTAHTNDIKRPGEGKYLSSVDYERFLRGQDLTPEIPVDISNIRRARRNDGVIDSVADYHNAIMNIENPGPEYSLFDIGDELEIRNRYLLTSQVEARFERVDVANFTLDAGGGIYGALSIPRTDDDFEQWKWRMDPCNFDEDSGGIVDDKYKYDRRHVCTFYSFVRNIRSPYPSEVDLTSTEAGDVFIPYRGVADIRGISSNTIESRKKILHLLYAFRAYFLTRYPTEDYKQAARRAAQVVANMIDFVDNYDGHTAGVMEGPFYDDTDSPPLAYDYDGQANADPTFINRKIVRNLILEVSTDTLGLADKIDIGDPAPAILSPYEFGLGVDDPDETVYGYERQPFIVKTFCGVTPATPPQMITLSIDIYNPYDSLINLHGSWQIKVNNVTDDFSILGAIVPHSQESVTINIDNLSFTSGVIIELQRLDPNPANTEPFITVDKTLPEQTDYFGFNIDKQRNIDSWGFANIDSIDGAAKGFQMPVANNNEDLATLLDLEKVLFIGNEKGETDPNTITAKIAAASGESEIRFDITAHPDLLGYVSLLNRDEGTLPGRININTATMEVIRAAIPPVDSWSVDCNDIADGGPYNDLSDLLNIAGFNQFADPSDQVGDSEMGDDFEERDWILSRVGNIFTVRSDVFTAYILVRLGVDGPQKRMIAILDRSGVYLPSDKPKIVALHPVSDPR